MGRLDPPQLAERFERLRERLARARQEHVLRFWGDLDDAARAAFLDELEGLDVELITRLSRLPETGSDRGSEGALSPAPVLRLGEKPSPWTRREATEHGEALLAAGRVGLFLVAGGQGSRLGLGGPKGCVAFGPLSGRSLYEIHAQSVRALRERYRADVPWYVMTSPANDNDAATRAFFARHRFFGLPPGDVVFLQQAVLPAVDLEGRLVLADRGRLFQSPNGHGGAFAAFGAGGGIEDAQRRGVEHLFYYQVDNPLVRIADPFFLGLHDLTRSEMSLKVLEKTGPEENIGVVAMRGGRPAVIEYSELKRRRDIAARRDGRGRLVFGMGSIAIHAFTLELFTRVARGAVELPYHVAEKEVEGLDEEGVRRKLRAKKFERFVFDALPSAQRFLCVEVAREEEFAPVKNATGVDSLESARGMVVAEHRRWLREAGIEVRGRAEISPLVAARPEELEAVVGEVESLAKWRGKAIDGDVRVEKDERGEVELEVVESVEQERRDRAELGGRSRA
jgi:UDP-N-acetylglucosamine/UDP-N-acetylgalactosamine diphosphorylase